MESNNPTGQEPRPTEETPATEGPAPAPVDLTQPAAPYGPYTPVPYTLYVPPPREPFTAQKSDAVFAVACVLLGYIMVRWGAPWYQGWGVTACCLAFAAVVGLYARAKGVRPQKESWYWLAITLLTGLAYSLWPGGWLEPARALLLLGATVYWCGTLFGVLLRGKTSNYLPLDALNLTLLMPLRNYDTTLKTLRGLTGEKKSIGQKLRAAWPVLLGLLLCLPVLGIVLPLLASADTGNFSRFYYEFLSNFDRLTLWRLFPYVWPWVLAVPFGLYLYWMLAGAAHKRYTKNVDPDSVRRTLGAMAFLPQTTVVMVLGAVSVVYVLFIGCQLPYFFSGFAGVRPEGYSIYSEYARQGFFELCAIAAINLGLMAVGGGFCRTSVRQSRLLRGLNLALCGLTLLLVATAFSKMLLYMAAYGLTPKRVCTCVFMLFLAGVTVAVMVLQFKRFSIMRFAAVFGAGLLCALCLCNLDAQIDRYNAAYHPDAAISYSDYWIE